MGIQRVACPSPQFSGATKITPLLLFDLKLYWACFMKTKVDYNLTQVYYCNFTK